MVATINPVVATAREWLLADLGKVRLLEAPSPAKLDGGFTLDSGR